ncbi:RNA methyltransferase [Brevundimonas sp. PAMC22021]|uniref:TrmH family RNA methyltransferase n=1 Tax=Brevundimonas sp. PAMC22021 TaxID=2861285 RepID=UPI001C62DE82|nr:RNA methyltransferase [Brevundimonas sp. PAMC22021]QYF88186.1 RNA methyltransferase [Brevundimonas sp. PAMC22021]
MIRIDDPEDPRIAAFRDIRERDLTGRQGLFVAEGEVVVRVLASAASRCPARALLLAENRAEAMADVADGIDAPTYVAPQAVLDRIAGFPLHRGILALGEKPRSPGVDDLLAGAGEAAAVVVACGIGNHDNIGGLFRNAAAFGAHAVLLDDRCCDPFYRKAVRVSVGAVLRTPFAVGGSAEAIVERLLARRFEILALTPGASETLAGYRREGPVAIVLGSEGPGLPAEVIARCRAVGVPMHGGFDSLNVAATSAIALHHLTSPLLSGQGRAAD